jgi:hypothetical protein
MMQKNIAPFLFFLRGLEEYFFYVGLIVQLQLFPGG